MGTTLTGTTPQDTYDSLIKVTNNGPLSSTARYLSDGLGNDSVLALSTAVVGINTSSPNTSYPLSVASASNANAIAVFGRASDNTGSIDFYQSNGSSRILEFGVSTTQVDIYNDLNTPMLFSTNATERMRITGAGNVGIGTSSPSFKLSVNGGYIQNTDGTRSVLFGSDGTGALAGTNTNHYFRFITNDAERLRITEDGYVRLTSGSGGIQFNSDTAAANALDDYEEGTWTPVYAGGFSGITYVNTVGKYTKIGRVVHWSCRIQASAATATASQVIIGGFPFTNSTNVETAGSIGFFGVYTTAAAYVYNEPNTTNIAAFYKTDTNPLLGTDLTSVTGTIHCSGAYMV